MKSRGGGGPSRCGIVAEASTHTYIQSLGFDFFFFLTVIIHIILFRLIISTVIVCGVFSPRFIHCVSLIHTYIHIEKSGKFFVLLFFSSLFISTKCNCNGNIK